MANRTRKVQLKFWVTEEERAIIERKMEMLKTKNMGAYLRKMAIDGYIIQVDYTEQKKLAAAVNKIGANINASYSERHHEGQAQKRFGACCRYDEQAQQR